jgi:hypothetical protein
MDFVQIEVLLLFCDDVRLLEFGEVGHYEFNSSIGLVLFMLMWLEAE